MKVRAQPVVCTDVAPKLVNEVVPAGVGVPVMAAAKVAQAHHKREDSETAREEAVRAQENEARAVVVASALEVAARGAEVAWAPEGWVTVENRMDVAGVMG